jgi:hypothetical protein
MLVEGSASEELLVHVSYLRALIKHEQAERLRLGPASSKADLEEARQAWKEAVVLWSDSQIRNQHPQPGREAGPLKARAQQKLAEVLSAQARTDPAKQVQAGEALEAAAALWEDLLGMRKDLEALGYRWQLKQLRK